MRDHLSHSFEQRFGACPTFAARAPGRVNLIGEHTDYSEGWVLPLAIDRQTWVVGRVRDDRRFRIWADDLGDAAEFDSAALSPRRQWVDYVQAVVWTLEALGVAVRGCDLAIGSEVPRECGLSSSAALGVAVAAALDAAYGLGGSARDWARIAHRGECDFVGVGCGIMDQFASALGRRDCALRIDCRTQETTFVPLPADRLAIVIANSGVKRALAGAEAGYLDRVAECRAAVEAARAAGIAHSGVTTLRDLSEVHLPELERALEPKLFRRARHVITENARVMAVCESLRLAKEIGGASLASVGECLIAGQDSLRDDFEVSTPELDALCDIADAQPGVFGSRLTGAGLGGCTLHLVAPPAAERLASVLATEYQRRFGHRPEIHRVQAADGASILA